MVEKTLEKYIFWYLESPIRIFSIEKKNNKIKIVRIDFKLLLFEEQKKIILLKKINSRKNQLKNNV